MILGPKHLTPYLPYSLKIMVDRDKANVAYMSTKRIAFCYVDGVGEVEKIQWKYAHKSVKPILRPLSDLNKEIEHNRENFIPIGKLHYLLMRTPTGRKTKAQYEVIDDFEYIGTRAKHQELIKGVSIWKFNTGMNSYFVMKKLFEWHFDIFGLIDEGLAVDINKLKTLQK